MFMSGNTQLQAITPPDTKQLEHLEKGGGDILTIASGFEIKNREDWEVCEDFVTQSINPILKEIDETFDKTIAGAYKTHKDLIEMKKRFARAPNEAKALTLDKMKKWELADKARIDKENKEKEEANRKIMEEQAKEAEKVRKENERIAEAARKEQERIAEEKRLETALELEKAGKTEEAEKALEVPATPAAPVFEMPAPALPLPAPLFTPEKSIKKSASTAKVQKWGWRLRGTAESAEINRAYLVPNTVEINKIVKALGPKAVNEIGNGIEIFDDLEYRFSKK